MPSDTHFMSDPAKVINPSSAATGAPTPVSASPASCEDQLAAWWRELLELDSVGLDDDFFDLGGHSLIGVQLFGRIKAHYGVELPLSSLFDARTIHQLAQLIRESSQPSAAAAAASKSSSTLVPIQPSGSLAPLYIIPGGYGTTVLPFRELALLLGPDQPVYGFETKMPEAGVELESIPERAARFLEDLRAVQPHGPYSLFGWCGGGYLAYEMAQTLTRQGETVALLAIVEAADPQYPRTFSVRLRFIAERGSWRLRNFLKRGPRGIARWAAEHLRSALHLRSARANSQPSAASASSAALDDNAGSLALFELDDRVWRTVRRYHPQTFAGNSVIILGEDSWKYCGLSPAADPRLVWSTLCQSGAEIVRLPGDHMSMLRAPVSPRFAQALRACLSRPKISAS